jgi:hypothetical protein
MNIQQLKPLWDSEKEKFKEKELGALQNFVRKVFECVELFNLEEGKESTAPHYRKNVFIQEDTDSKASNRPDFVLYLEINQTQIKIPVEVEKHENIKAGEKQIKIYKDLYNAVYAILTDGNEWRFYNGDTVCQKLKLDEILDEPEIFKTFWKEYTLPETYYVSFFERMVSQRSLFEREGLKIEENREMFFDDITELIRNFKNKLRLSQYFNKEKDPDKVATEISYAYVIQYILYKTLVDDDYSDKKNEFLERFKVVHKSLKENIFGEVLSQATHIAEYISENLYRPFSAEQKYIEERLTEIKRQTRKSISDISAWLDIFIFIKKYNFTSVRNELFGYIYENYLKELYGDKNKGQYFTDPAVVEFMLDEIGYTADEIKRRIKEKPDKPDISIIDPACGSGTFLYSAAKRIIDAVYKGDEKTAKQAENLISENVFGLDIAVFPLYLAEMGILMKMLTLIANEKYNNPMEKKIKLFKTDDSIAEFVDMMHSISEKDGQKEMFISHILDESKFMRDEQNLAEMKGSMRPPRRRFDFVIGNPPYIGYNECCGQTLAFTQLIKQKRLSMADVYGVNLNTVPKRIKPYSPKPNLYAFFIALGISLLKDNCRISYIIPQTILTAGDLDVLRYHLSKNTAIEKIITFAGKMFIGRGLKQKKPVATSSLVFVVHNKKGGNSETEIINFEDSEINNFKDYFIQTKKQRKILLQHELLDNIASWNYITKSSRIIDIRKKYNHESISIDEYRWTLKHYDILQFDKGLVFDRKEMMRKSNHNTYQLAEASNNYKPHLTGSYVLENKLRFPQGTQGIDVYNNRYKIIWSYTKLKFYFSDEKIMVGSNWLIISSNDKNEVLYLLTILNHPLNKIILNAEINLGNEKLLIASIKSIKEFVRIPKITKENQFIKDEVVKRTEEMLDLEDCQLQDFIDFSEITKQKFDSAEVRGNHLILSQNREEYKAPIKSKKDVVKAVLKESFGEKDLFPGEIVLSELKHLMALDKDLQESLKDYIDDLVFALYFNVPVKKIGINLASQIKELCRQNKFYDYIQKEMQENIK